MYFNHGVLYQRLFLAAVVLFATSQAANDIHLLTQPSDILPELIQEEFGNITIPCLSTSNSVKVMLFKNYIMLKSNSSYEGIMNFKYNPKVGFLLQNLTERSSGVYSCRASYNNSVNTAVYKLKILPPVKKAIIKKKDGLPNIITVGQNLSFDCSVKMDSDVPFELYWRVPHEHETGHIHVGELNVLSDLKSGNLQMVASRTLNIDNVSADDDGNYFCEAIVNSLRISRAAYTLQVHTPHDFYLSLSVQGGVSEIVIDSGTPEVELIVEVSANPEPILIWKDPYGIVVGKTPEKISFKNDKNISKLIIKDLELFDSGVYQLYANNRVFQNRIYVSLFVKSRPIINGIFYSDPSEEVQAAYTFGCNIYGYPLPNFDWVFKGCANNPECDKSDVEVKKIVSNVEVSNVFIHHVKTFISFNINGTGMLMCKASNAFGIAYENLSISVD